MLNIDTHGHLFLSKRSQIKALEMAVHFRNLEGLELIFSEKDLSDTSDGNYIGKLKLLADEGYIKLEISEYEIKDSEKKHYKLDSIRLTVNGEKLLKSYSILSKFGSLIVGIVSAFIATYLAFKAGIL